MDATGPMECTAHAGPAGWIGRVLLCVFAACSASAIAAPSAQTASAHSTQAGAPAHSARKPICFDTLFYVAMPGLTNYCLGLRDWESGHYDDGLELLKLAAGWGNKGAQYTLGLIYYNGHHVAANPALGMAWLELANQRHNDTQIARVARSVAKLATPEERKQARVLYRQMLPRYGDKVAATRAWHHLRHWQRHRDGNAGVICVYGRQAWAINHAGQQGMEPLAVVRAMETLNAQSSTPLANGGMCPGGGIVSFAVQERLVRHSAAIYFDGWIGNVSVGPLQQVPAPAASSGKR